MLSTNLIIGLFMLILCIVIQCLVVGLLVRVLAIVKAKKMVKPKITHLIGALTCVMLIMVVGNMIQASLWAGLFVLLGEFQEFSTSLYFSVTNFTTLGNGDIFISDKHRLLGAFEAGNGVLMLGLTTSILFLVLNMAVQKTLGDPFSD